MRQLKIRESITDRDSTGILQRYFNDLSKIPLLTPDEEAELGRQIKENYSQETIDKLVKANLRFVVSVAKQYQGQGFDLPDLISEGNIGLMKAASRRDYTRGFKFISYAVRWIRRSILDSIHTEGRVIKLPTNKIHKMKKIEALINEELVGNNSVLSSTQISERLSFSLDSTKEMLMLIFNKDMIKIDALLQREIIVNDNNGVSNEKMWHEALHVENSANEYYSEESLYCDIERVLNTLTPKQSDSIRLFFDLNRQDASTMADMKEEFELSATRIHNIRAKAIRRMKHITRSNILKKYLG